MKRMLLIGLLGIVGLIATAFSVYGATPGLSATVFDSGIGVYSTDISGAYGVDRATDHKTVDANHDTKMLTGVDAPDKCEACHSMPEPALPDRNHSVQEDQRLAEAFFRMRYRS